MFLKQIRFRVGKDKIVFWKDLCVGETPLATTFPDLFLCASDRDARVGVYTERRGGSILLGPIFKRDLNEMETSQFRALMELLSKVFIPRIEKDIRIWIPSTNGLFLVASLYLT
eukprot:TRINITY_DN22974_c0_g1_i1.p2 TRINITY_DN22974_c0_g1~~TRINITY_DN22974_c0_g1_i1.p2  ORF type:complete len:114 (-),score=16.42 TRINITY_DN22974_c0_g1_i1:691-1032(-)